MFEENYSYRFEYYILKSDGTNITERIQLWADSGFFQPKCFGLEWDMKMGNKNHIQYERKEGKKKKKIYMYTLFLNGHDFMQLNLLSNWNKQFWER